MHWLTAHWQQFAAVLAVLALYWLSVYVARTPTLRASGLVTLLGDVLLAFVAPVPGVGPALVRLLVALRLATAPDRGTREVPVVPEQVRPAPPIARVALLLLAAGVFTLPACANWRNDAGGIDPVSATARARLAERADRFGACAAPVALRIALRVAGGALMLAVEGRLADPSGWAALLRPIIADEQAGLVRCATTPEEQP